jgi:hypothetical protein
MIGIIIGASCASPQSPTRTVRPVVHYPTHSASTMKASCLWPCLCLVPTHLKSMMASPCGYRGPQLTVTDSELRPSFQSTSSTSILSMSTCSCLMAGCLSGCASLIQEQDNPSFSIGPALAASGWPSLAQAGQDACRLFRARVARVPARRQFMVH